MRPALWRRYRDDMIGKVITVAVAVAALATGTASAGYGIAPDSLVQFRSPTGKIGCVATNMDGPFSLRCDVATPLYRRPTRARSCPLDYGEYGDSFTLPARARAVWTCHGDTTLGAGRVLRYGRTWSWGPFRCTMRTSGITCRNRGGHGFVLSQQRAARF